MWASLLLSWWLAPVDPFLSRYASACNLDLGLTARVRIRGDDPDMPDHPVFARFYDRLTARTERGGLGAMRSELLSSAAGRGLELGAGNGANLQHFTDAVTELVLARPGLPMGH